MNGNMHRCEVKAMRHVVGCIHVVAKYLLRTSASHYWCAGRMAPQYISWGIFACLCSMLLIGGMYQIKSTRFVEDTDLRAFAPVPEVTAAASPQSMLQIAMESLPRAVPSSLVPLRTTTAPSTSTRPPTTVATTQSLYDRHVADVQAAAAYLGSVVAENISDIHTEITRGVVAFLPAGVTKYENEFKSLYLSIALMRTQQPAHVKTDMLILTQKRGIDFCLSLGCSLVHRERFSDPEGCFVAEHIPLSERSPADDLSPYSSYAASINIVAEFAFAFNYTYLLKTDLDGFLTFGFSAWVLPAGVDLVVGRGGYATENSISHLTWIMSKRLSIKNAKISNVGTTWYGKAAIVIGAAKVSMAAMRFLDAHEFNAFEKCCAGTNSWPHWYWPVLTMYSGHIAVNQLTKASVMSTVEGVVELDYGSDISTPLRKSVKHLHCWHSDKQFSKFAFTMGAYKTLNLTSSLAMQTPKDYASVIAISMSRLSTEEFKTVTASHELMKNGSWVRVTHTDKSPPLSVTNAGWIPR